MTERYPVHIHLHPHATVADYDGVKALIAQDQDPFLLFMPEVANSQSITCLQQISDGDQSMLRIYRIIDEGNRRQGISMDANAARGRALAEAVFDSGIYVVGIHPEWDEHAMLEDVAALGENRNLQPTFLAAIDALRQEMPEIARIIDQRDSFAADKFLEHTEAAVAMTSEFDGLDHVPCLVEIGSLHFGLADRLANEGFMVTASGNSPDTLMGAQQQGIAHLLLGGSVSDLDLERIALEDVLHQIIRTETSVGTQAAVNSVIDKIDDRAQWPILYEDTVMHLTP
ncbi:MAG: hypothetical protein KIH63_000345 [Candidatus Saccharibacteria bacterium]|nr:hypothetical protein [Candidatus Saccharibacteria bacterium]